mmetsp:Transcript_135349/g.235358  ORF Transcript_135349/g.235358 Transcript_135349/m.235358 type:complete len:597 (+) Transcript_135349:105-1895(+)
MHANAAIVFIWCSLHAAFTVGAENCDATWDPFEQPAHGDVLLQSWHARHSSQDTHLEEKDQPRRRANSTSSKGGGVVVLLQQLDNEAVTGQQPAVQNATTPQPQIQTASAQPPGIQPAPAVANSTTPFPQVQSASTQPPEVTDVHDTEREVAHSAVAAMLLLFVAFIMTLFYLVNFPDVDIQRATWQLLSRTISIFIAVLISKSTKEVMCEGLQLSCEHKISHRMSAVSEAGVEYAYAGIGIAFARWLMFWIIFQLYMLQYSGTFIVAISKLGGHIVAFAGLDAFTALQNGQAPFDLLRDKAINSFFCAMLVSLLLLLFLGIWGGGRKFFVERSSKAESLHHWLEYCNEAENEAASLVVGLLLSQAIRHAIAGEHPPLHGGKPKSKSNDQVFLLFACAIGVGAVVTKLEYILQHLRTLGPRARHSKGLARFIRVVVDTVSMTMAWCLLYWGEWFIYNWTDDRGVGHGDRMTALLVVAGVLSFICFMGIIVLVFAARHHVFEAHTTGLHALGIALGLVVGCAWEDVFIEAVGGVNQLNVFELKASYSTLLIIFILCIVTLPAWMLYILPQAERKRAEASTILDDEDGASSTSSRFDC